uniref:Reverse transcriptase domain-containing protein n=1 Tax=Amphimedon queenslandica TaxID=400682 RepID=A0A1X7V3B7_AMPQE
MGLPEEASSSTRYPLWFTGNIRHQLNKARSLRKRDVFTGFSTLNIHKASGIDNIPSIVLKSCATAHCEPIHHLFVQCVNQAYLPQEWKTHCVTPIFKSGDKGNVKNYRPISLLCIVSKGCQSDVIYLDIRKAFDSVSHTVLLTKLWQAGLCGKVDCVLKKAYNVLRMIKRLFPAATTPTVVKKLYLFLAVPILTYCSPVWRPSLVKNIVILEQLQRRATKYILFDYQSDYKSRLSSLKLLPLSYRLEYIESVFFFVQFKHPDHSYDICNYFSFSTCSTRSSAHNKSLSQSREKIKKLKQEYRKLKDKLNKTGEEGKQFLIAG